MEDIHGGYPMYAFESSIFINRSPQDVFDYVSEPANNTQWQSGVESSEWTSDGPRGVGATYMVERSFLGRRTDSEIEMSVWDPPNQTRGRTINGPVQLEVTTDYEAQEDGTQLTVSAEAEFDGFFKMAEGLVGKQVEKQVASDLAALKLLLESD
jgi:carbon monoxide dehydrogenase subunit G